MFLKIQPFSFNSQFFSRAFSLVEVLIGTFLILLVFLGIFGIFHLALKITHQSSARITATALANQQIEIIRALPYESVGVVGGFPEGILEATITTKVNNIEYTIETRVDFIVDSADGLVPPEDECPNDYKRVQVKVSWPGMFGGEVKLVTDVAPENLVQECAVEGGILSVSVFDAYGVMVNSPLIEIISPETGQTLKTATPSTGQHYFSLPAGSYRVVVSKEGYSRERTYSSDEIATPEKPNPIVLEGQLTEISFSIDKLSSFSINTLSPWGTDLFIDTFLDESKISQIFNVIISEGEVNLAKTNGEYQESGFLVSTTTAPGDLISWDEFSFTDSQPTNTEIRYQVLYFDGENWTLIPDSDLSGNSTGFQISPVDLSNLATTTYSQLRLRGNFSTQSTSTSPTLYDWQISWITSEPTPIPNVSFHLQGAKIIGLDVNEDPVYKYSKDHTSDSQGHIDITDLEWDSYTFSVDPATDLDLIDTDPSPQPIDLSPDTNLSVTLYLEAENSLLLTVQNEETAEPIFAATVRLSNANLGYDTTQYTNEKGQTYFIPLEPENYNLEIQAPGYADYTGTIMVSGDVIETVGMEQIE